jgi:hypothetical protein
MQHVAREQTEGQPVHHSQRCPAPHTEPEQRGFKSKASQYFTRKPSFASTRSAPATFESSTTHSSPEDAVKPLGILHKARRTVSALAAKFLSLKREAPQSRSFRWTPCSLTSQAIGPNLCLTWIPHHPMKPIRHQQCQHASFPASHQGLQDIHGPALEAWLMQTPASQALETAQMSICRRHGQYKSLHRRLPSLSVYGLFASQTCLLQAHSTDRGAFKRLNQMAAQKKAGADSRIDFPNASRTSMAR